MRAASICVVKELTFTLNMVLTAQNRNEIGEMVVLAEQLGSAGVRFGHLMPTPETALRKLDVSPEDRREIESEIWGLKQRASIPVGMAPGYFQRVSFFPLRTAGARRIQSRLPGESHSVLPPFGLLRIEPKVGCNSKSL